MPAETDAELRELLGFQRIAVVGCSTTPTKDAHQIPKYLQQQGYKILPVNPNAAEVLGQTAWDTLADVPELVELVDVFRPSEEVARIVDAAIAREDVQGIWLQLGIQDDTALERAESAGLQTVQDRCMKVEHQRLFGSD